MSRGLLAGMSIEELRRRRSSPPHAAVWTKLVSWWREIVARDAAAGEYVGLSGMGWHSVTPGVVAAAAIWRIDGTREALEHVERCIGYLAEIYEGPADFVKSLPSQHRMPVLSHGEIAMAADMCRDDLKPETVKTLCRIVREHILPSTIYPTSLIGYSGGGNIIATRNIQAGIAALLWGEESGYADWQASLDHACDVCRQYLRHGLDAQGSGFEGTGYTQAMTGQIALMAHLMQQAGLENMYASEPMLHKAPLASLPLVFPDRTGLINMGDVGVFNQPEPGELLWASREYRDPVLMGLFAELSAPRLMPWPADFPASLHAACYQVRDLLYIFLHWDPAAPATPLTKASLPTAFYSPGTEITAFRTSWGRDSVFVNFLGSGRSHTALTHGHQDSGHVSIFAYGDYLAIDTGRYNGSSDQHSVMLVEGDNDPSIVTAQWGTDHKAGRITSFQRHELLDYAKADCANQRQCIWADRHLLFVRLGGDDCYVVTIDNVNKNNDRHMFWWQLHANPRCKIDITGQRTAAISGPRARLDLTFAIPEGGIFANDPHKLELRADEKWWSWPYGKGQDISAMQNTLHDTSVKRPRLSGVLNGLSGQMVATMVPRRSGQAALPVTTRAENGVIRVDVQAGAVSDTILVAIDHGYIRVPGFRGLTELAVVRRGANGLVTYWTSNGAPLEIE